MPKLKVAAPAKINLTLEVLNKRDDGFHNIKSIMQAISLYDYLTVEIEETNKTEIILSGNSNQIPYDEKNLVYKASQKFFEATNIKNIKTTIYVEKNIPVEAGLAGGSTDAAATFFALNELLNKPLNKQQLELLCATLGSDLNFCLNGGTAVCSGRGEHTKKIRTTNQYVSLIKPLGFGISAKEAYTKFSQMENKIVPNYTEKMEASFNEKYLFNSLEQAVINDYDELIEIKTKLPASMMSGSGPTFFVFEKEISEKFDNKRFQIIENLKFIEDGIKIV